MSVYDYISSDPSQPQRLLVFAFIHVFSLLKEKQTDVVPENNPLL